MRQGDIDVRYMCLQLCASLKCLQKAATKLLLESPEHRVKEFGKDKFCRWWRALVQSMQFASSPCLSADHRRPHGITK